MMKHGTVLFFLCVFFLPSSPLFSQTAGSSASSGPAPESRSVEEQRRDTIRYGTESEIAVLIQALRSENSSGAGAASYLDGELVSLAQGTLNRNILTGVFSFFGDRGEGGLEDRAQRAVAGWDAEADETVIAAITYLGKMKTSSAVQPLENLIANGDTRFMSQVFRALGRIAGGNENIRDGIAAYLMDYAGEKLPPDENRRELVSALGDSQSPEAIGFLAALAGNGEERLGIRVAAVEALSAIGSPAGLEAVIGGVSSSDPNLRAASVAALGPFSGPEVDHAILEAFRDDAWRARLGAAQAAGRRKMADAVPYLEYRVRNDRENNVKDACVRALGDIGNRTALSVLESLFQERGNSDRIRVLSAEMLVRENADRYAAGVIEAMDDAKRRNQNVLYNGFLRVAGTARTAGVETLAERFLASGGPVEKSFALDMIANNRFTRLYPQVELLADPKNGNLARRAQSVLERIRRGDN